MKPFELNPKQQEAQALLAGQQTRTLLVGGSRSGKTFFTTRAIIARALAAPGSRHVILRFRMNACWQSIGMDTLPKVMRLCFPTVAYTTNKQLKYFELPNGSQIWLGGLDDAQRVEKILGLEFCTVYLNESSQIPWESVGVVITRMAQVCYVKIEGREPVPLRVLLLVDCNPPKKNHWTYKLFILKADPETGKPLPDPENYASIVMNPADNMANLSPEYIRSLEALSPRLQKRFLRGEFADANPNGIFDDASIEKWRVMDGELPDMVRIIVGVDPSGSGDVDNADNDAIGIMVVGLGTDGIAYVLEDCTVKAGPATWGRIATQAYDRHQADVIVGEINYGGAMVAQVITMARPRTPFKAVTSSRGKVLRAEPFSAPYDTGKIRHVGIFPELEEEMAAFSTAGYTGSNSPNRVDALVFCLAELFPGIVAPRREPAKKVAPAYVPPSAWLG